ncbi:MAG: transcriptional regulator [Erysipelotrichia bacterium]|nr:transcriptional regulator [Erysipelotrichia bacterium]NCC54515.1 transcriptional regulator [Erysipelotrichia bacterium]
MKKQYDLPCNIAQTLNLIGDKWTLLILHAIECGNHTYKQLQDTLGSIPTNLLSNRLKELEKDGLLVCSLYQEHPPRYQYELSECGRDLHDLYNVIALWGEKHLQACPKKVTHKKCHHPVKVMYYCKHCNTYVEAEDIEIK